MGRDTLARAARELVPMHQGDLDGLCGLYAIVNAVQVALYATRELNRTELQSLFSVGVTLINRSRRLPFTIVNGMDERLWHRLCRGVLDQASYIAGGPVTASRILIGPKPLDTRDMIRRIKHSVRAGHPVLITLAGSYNHWTVVTSFSATRLNLFDSSSYHWVNIRSIGSGLSARPHLLQPGNVVALSCEVGGS